MRSPSAAMLAGIGLLAMFRAADGPASCAALREDERLLFIPTMATQELELGAWQLDVHAWVMEMESRPLALPVLLRALDLEDENLTAAERARFEDRARWFLADNERGKRISIRLGGTLVPLGRTEANGRLQTRVTVAGPEVERMRSGAVDQVIRFTSPETDGHPAAAGGEAHLVASTGLSVISDIDDTLKISGVRNREELLRNTFLRPFQPVPAMAEAYRSWAATDRAQFHYVSASPIQLYVPLAAFLNESGFPKGTFHLKEFRWTDETFFNLFTSPEKYKRSVIEPILRRLPQRRFVLMGDSGEKDPEIYGELAREFPEQVLRIYIRDVTDEPATSARYQAAFRGMERSQWRVFRDPTELGPSVR